MCEFLSWIEYEKNGERHLFYLTARELRTKRGHELRERIGWDINGHGAIREYYELGKSGVDRECMDFSSPDNFPPEIVTEIKAGAFRGFGIVPRMLSAAARVEYDRQRVFARIEYHRQRVAARVEYDRQRAAAWVEYDRKINIIFWDLFADPENRIGCWR